MEHVVGAGRRRDRERCEEDRNAHRPISHPDATRPGERRKRRRPRYADAASGSGAAMRAVVDEVLSRDSPCGELAFGKPDEHVEQRLPALARRLGELVVMDRAVDVAAAKLLVAAREELGARELDAARPADVDGFLETAVGDQPLAEQGPVLGADVGRVLQ
jgi:hypothetical protein